MKYPGQAGAGREITICAASYKLRQRLLTVQKKLHPEVLEYWSIGVLEKGNALTSK
jgi:hypothetical protein